MDNEKWYRTGAAAKILGTSPHRIREVARAGLIESQLRNGYRYIHDAELQRLRKDGLPPMPATTAIDETQDAEEHADPRPRAGRRLMEELYSEPSRALAKSKETVLRLSHTAEAKRLKQQMRELDRATRDEQERTREAQRIRDWRERHIRTAAASVPGEQCAGVCAKVEELLGTVPPCTDITRQVDDIIQATLRPAREREGRERLAAQHREVMVRAAQRSTLPPGATHDETQEARELLASMLPDRLKPGATDRQIRSATDEVLRPILERIAQRQVEAQRQQAEVERQRAESFYQFRISQVVDAVSYRLVMSDATTDEITDAQTRLRAALGRLPANSTSADMDRARNAALAPLEATLRERKERKQKAETEERERQQRERSAAQRADSLLLRHVETALDALEKADDVEFDGYSDRLRLRDKLIAKIRPRVIAVILADPTISDSTIKGRTADYVDEFFEAFCE